ncbi:MAG: CaiB/BaiF CoA transferase family protein [Sphingomonadaceae bacterium]
MANSSLAILSGVKILSFTQFLLGPAAVQYLADLGADVIKIEPPGAGAWERGWSGPNAFVNGVSVFFLSSHRNARSLTLNLKHPKGQDAARRLITEADVLVQNFRPGVMERMGLGYDEVKKLNPRIIYASASGYGEDSPFRDLPGQDLLIQALSGLIAITGRAGELPVAPGAAIVDQHSAALLAMGILAALLHRERTGEGQKVEIAMVRGALDLQMEPLVYFLNGSTIERPREPLASSYHPAPYGVYETGDGYIVLSLSPIKAIRQALGDPPELAPYEDPKLAVEKKNEIRKALDPLLRRLTTQEAIRLLQSHGIWCARVNDYEQAMADPTVRFLEPVLEVDHPQAGQVRLLRHPVKYSAGEPELRRVPPGVGEHTEEILAGLGYSAEEIQGMRAAGAI